MVVSPDVLKTLINVVGKVLIEGVLPSIVIIISHRHTRRSIKQVDRKVDDVKTEMKKRNSGEVDLRYLPTVGEIDVTENHIPQSDGA